MTMKGMIFEDQNILDILNDPDNMTYIVESATFTIYSDKVIVRINENKIREIIGDKYSETFKDRFVAIVRENTIIPILMADMGIIQRNKLHDAMCRDILEVSIRSTFIFKLPQVHEDNYVFITAVPDKSHLTLTSRYGMYSDIVCIKINAYGSIGQFVKDNYTVHHW